MINVKDGYILSITADSMTPEIQNAINAAPTAPSGYTVRLRADTLEWELVELPPMPEDGEATIEDYEAALSEVGV